MSKRAGAKYGRKMAGTAGGAAAGGVGEIMFQLLTPKS